jgi:uncharacterized protein YndB with AHSA1/START domain
MTKGFESKISVAIDAPRTRVWQALTDPEDVRQYLHGTKMSTDWKVGGPITWTGEWKGQEYVDKGTVLAVEPERLLRTTHWSSMGGSEDKPENYHTVTYELSGDGKKTTLTLTQDNNPSPEAAEQMAQNNWRPVLEGLKQVAEQKAG